MAIVLRKCAATIDLAAVRHNFKVACELAPASRSIAVIKADAYGHGAIEVAKALHGHATAFAVALVEEAIELRDAGIREPILVLQGVNGEAALQLVAAQSLSLVVHNEQQLECLCKARLATPIPVWLKIDTGMHRLGIAPAHCAMAVRKLRDCGSCAEPIVVCTHLASADEPGSVTVAAQVTAFDDCVAGLNVEQSIANSAGIIAWPSTLRDWNRPGYMLYGNSPFTTSQSATESLQPVMRLTSEVIAVRDLAVGERTGYGGRWAAAVPSRVATVAIGYADGYPRHARDGTPTLVNGAVAPLAGTVSMDAITIDITSLPEVSVGDQVLLWGPELSVNEVANYAGTVGYELLTGVSSRVPRVYLG